MSPSVIVVENELIGPGDVSGARDITQAAGHLPLAQCNNFCCSVAIVASKTATERPSNSICMRSKNDNGTQDRRLVAVIFPASTIDHLIKIRGASSPN
jgi:hypothetical protein